MDGEDAAFGVGALGGPGEDQQDVAGAQPGVRRDRGGGPVAREQAGGGSLGEAQEALTNVARHADAGRVCVELAPTFAGDAVQLRVVDDGRGPGDGREGAGMRGMRERAVLVGATLTVGSHQEGGTELRLLVPVPRPGDGP